MSLWLETHEVTLNDATMERPSYFLFNYCIIIIFWLQQMIVNDRVVSDSMIQELINSKFV